MSYVYLDFRSKAGCFTVGFYDPNGEFHPESDHDTQDAAAARVHYLNGGSRPELGELLKEPRS